MNASPKKVLTRLAELHELAIEAPKNTVDIIVNYHGHVKQLTIIIIADCSDGMYINGKQPEPVTHVHFSIYDEKAEQFIENAINTATTLIAERKSQNKDAA